MKRHLTLAMASQPAREDSETATAKADRRGAGDRQVRRSPSLAGPRGHLKLAGDPAWRHTLVLRGGLDYRSAPDLEEEIECLCEEGVTNLTLDLRELEAIDAMGVQVIAFWSSLCRRRGHAFAVIPGSSGVHHALAETGAGELLDPEVPYESTTPRLFMRPASAPFATRATSTVKAL